MMECMVELGNVLNVLTKLVVLVGVPIGLCKYFAAVRKEQRDRELGTYNALDEKYLAYLELCLKHTDLDIFDIPDNEISESRFGEDKGKAELIAFTMLMAVFERAFLMYSDNSDRIRTLQWVGWREYMQQFASRENFRDAWRISGNTFDERFQKFMDGLVKPQNGGERG